MKRTLLIICLVALVTTAFGQQNGSNQSTSLNGGRWEFFMSEIAIRLTFKIDKYTGDVFQMVETIDKTAAWELVYKQENDQDIRKENSINYQLFSSGQGIRHTYLLNTNTGLTWQLATGINDELIFEAIME